MPDQLSEWRGEFGDAYVERNQPTPATDAAIAATFASILSRTPGVSSILEAGANVGRNLRGVARVSTADLIGVEPNASAREQLAASGVANVLDGDLSRLPVGDDAVDLAFTFGVLIHVPDDALPTALAELHRVSRRWLLAGEYFSQRTEAIAYRGRTDLLWKRDYGSLWLDAYPDLEVVATGFLWRRTTPFDDLTWWLFRKP